MKRLLVLMLAFVLLSPSVHAEGLFNGLIPATPTPNPLDAVVTSEDTDLFIVEATSAVNIPEQLKTPAILAMFGVPEQVATSQGTALRYHEMDVKKFISFMALLETDGILTVQYDVVNSTLLLLCGESPVAADITAVTNAPSYPKYEHNETTWPEEDECSKCGGTGDCDECYGDGELRCSAYGCNGGSCLLCSGEDKCSVCGGDDECNTCNGTGYVDCRYCDGGRCPACD